MVHPRNSDGQPDSRRPLIAIGVEPPTARTGRQDVALRAAALILVFLCACTPGGLANRSTARPTPTLVSTPFPLPTPTDYLQVCRLEGSVCACPPGEQGVCSEALPAALLRSLHLPKPAEGCPTTSGHKVETVGFGGVALGPGPVEPIIAADGDPLHGVAQVDWWSDRWYSFKTLWFVRPSYAGPVLVRGARIDGAGVVAFGEAPVIGHLIIPPGPTFNEYPDGYRTAPGGTYVQNPGCYAWQVDGTDFSYVIVFSAVRAPPLAPNGRQV